MKRANDFLQFASSLVHFKTLLDIVVVFTRIAVGIHLDHIWHHIEQDEETPLDSTNRNIADQEKKVEKPQRKTYDL